MFERFETIKDIPKWILILIWEYKLSAELN